MELDVSPPPADAVVVLLDVVEYGGGDESRLDKIHSTQNITVNMHTRMT